MRVEATVRGAGEVFDARQFVDRVERDVFYVGEALVRADAQRSLHGIGVEGLGGAERTGWFFRGENLVAYLQSKRYLVTQTLI